MENEKKVNYPQPMSFPVMVFWTGLFGGLFWGTIGFLASYLHFSEVPTNVILEPWALGDWKKEWLGTLISIMFIGLFSVVAAFLYYAILKKLNGFWGGLGFGIVLFLVVFLVLNPVFPGMKPLTELSRDTFITSMCLYIVYGIFIGYSINYEYLNHIAQKEEPAS